MSTNMKNDLDRVRASAQALHAAISDAAAKGGGAAKADLEAAGQKAKSVLESAKVSLDTQNETTRKYLKAAISSLESMHQHAGEALKASGQAFQTSMRQTLADARASVDKVTEAVAAKRAAESTKSHR